jgi:MFS family permease
MESLHISGTASALPFTIGIVMLGLSAAVFGTRVDHHGPRWAMFVATVCFCSGLLIAAYGVSIKQYWLVVVGYGVIGGIGLGIGYISPVSTLLTSSPRLKPGGFQPVERVGAVIPHGFLLVPASTSLQHPRALQILGRR